LWRKVDQAKRKVHRLPWMRWHHVKDLFSWMLQLFATLAINCYCCALIIDFALTQDLFSHYSRPTFENRFIAIALLTMGVIPGPTGATSTDHHNYPISIS
jgi:hypothetical protein